MKIELEIPDELSHGRGASFKKGISDALLESAKTELAHTPEGHEDSRKMGLAVGKVLVKFISGIVKP